MRKIGYVDRHETFVPFCELPETLSEMSSQHFLYFCELIQGIQQGTLTVDSAATHLAIRITGAHRLRIYNTRACNNISLVASLLIPLFHDTLAHSHNPFPQLPLPDGRTIRALGFGLTDATARDFLHLSTNLRRYMKDRTSRNMDYVLASLYPSADPDIRTLVEQAVSGLPAPAREHLFAFVSASYTFLTSGTIRLYGIRTSFRDIFYTPSSPAEESSDVESQKDFSDVLLSIAETGTFGPLEKVYDTNIVILLRFMQNKHEEAEKLKQKYKHVKKH